jgi:hypothetical protein
MVDGEGAAWAAFDRIAFVPSGTERPSRQFIAEKQQFD